MIGAPRRSTQSRSIRSSASASGVIGLDDNSDVGPVAKLGFLEYPAKELVAERAIGVLLHIDVNLGAFLAGESQDRPQPCGRRARSISRRGSARSEPSSSTA